MIAVVGSGPVGNYAAFQLAKAGHKVTLYEEHEKIGSPVQCTGIVTPDIHPLLKVKKSTIVNRIRHIDVIGPKEGSFRLRLSEHELILDRTGFDNSIADLASKYDVKIKKGHRFISRTKNKAEFITKDGRKQEKFDILVGADGPVSRVAKSSGLLTRRKHYGAMQATVKGDFEMGAYQTFFGQDYPEFFGWLVPESEDIARIGLGTRGNTNPYFMRFLKKHIGEDWEKKVIGYQNGLIPIHSPKHRIEKGNTFLIGDAATHVKATTGGGIIPGMKAGIGLAEAINEGKDYKRSVWRYAGKELLTHLALRKALDRFTDEDYERLIRLASRPRIKDILETTSREHPTEILMRSLVAEPRLMAFTKILFQKRLSTSKSL